MTEKIDLTGVQHHIVIDEVVELLCNRTENLDKNFFRMETAYFLGKMAGNMRATIITKDRKDIPVNIYTMAFAISGYGKGYSVSIMENELMKGFKKRLMGETLMIKSEEAFWVLARENAIKNNKDEQEEYDAIVKAYRRCGPFLFTFDNATPEGVKQLRHKLLLGNAGAISYQVDEIGSNLERSVEVLNLFLELYDQGMVKAKLTKNSSDNERQEELDGKTPTNMLLFGTPAKLFDGGSTENAFYSLLDTGYARRCLFGYGNVDKKARNTKTAAEIYADKINPLNQAAVTKWANHFTSLADPAMFGWQMVMEDDVAIMLMQYQIQCESAALELKDFQSYQRAELEHRYFKALKLAGCYAFVDGSNEIEMDHLMSAILLVEESGEAFQKILTRDKVHVRLARYMADVATEVTHPDLLDALPFYPKSSAARNEMMGLAAAWGYKNNVIIKKTFVDGIEFFRAETLTLTDLEKIILSASSNFAYEYDHIHAPWADLGAELCVAQDVDNDGKPNGQPMHWANHWFKNYHRSEENVIPGFNMLVLDVDGGISTALVHELLAEIKHLTYTTKRSTDDAQRFRLLIPINYIVELDKEEYKELVADVISWLPFKATGADIDESSGQRSKKWLTNHKAVVEYHDDGDLLDILPFIPKTKKNEDYRSAFKSVESMDNLERWFAGRMVSGSRNNHMIKFALALVDGGMDLISVRTAVLDFNQKLSNPLDEDEITTTIMTTVAKRIQKRTTP